MRDVSSSDSLRIALDICHPADFHFFRNALMIWREQNHDVLILSRDKEVVIPLLEEAGLAHLLLTRRRNGLLGLGVELIEHNYGAWQAMRRHKTQVATTTAGAFVVHAARLLGIPALLFYDTEHARLSNAITYPFATRIFTPRAYRDDLGPKQERFDGYKELAYLHPARFTPDPAKLAADGLEPGEPFTFVRLVSWQSHHDVGDYGVRDVYEVVNRLEQHGRVLISSEDPLPPDLQDYAYKGLRTDVHHVLAHARLLFGESATMASESAQLGVPAIFLSTSSRGYTDELEQRYGMVFNFNGQRALQAAALDCAESILSDPSAPQMFRERHARMMAEQIDVTAFVVDRVVRYARREA